MALSWEWENILESGTSRLPVIDNRTRYYTEDLAEIVKAVWGNYRLKRLVVSYYTPGAATAKEYVASNKGDAALYVKLSRTGKTTELGLVKPKFTAESLTAQVAALTGTAPQAMIRQIALRLLLIRYRSADYFSEHRARKRLKDVELPARLRFHARESTKDELARRQAFSKQLLGYRTLVNNRNQKVCQQEEVKRLIAQKQEELVALDDEVHELKAKLALAELRFKPGTL